MLMSDDFPTLLRPMNAYSGRSGLGQDAASGLLMMYEALCMTMNDIYKSFKNPPLVFDYFCCDGKIRT
jgi:hypothetical protein